MAKVFATRGVPLVLAVFSCAVIIVLVGSAIYWAQSPPNNSTNDFTLHQFNALYTGMTYLDAEKVLGHPGAIESENMLNDGQGGALYTVTYLWKNEDFSSMAATFQRGGLIHKSESGLK